MAVKLINQFSKFLLKEPTFLELLQVRASTNKKLPVIAVASFSSQRKETIFQWIHLTIDPSSSLLNAL